MIAHFELPWICTLPQLQMHTILEWFICLIKSKKKIFWHLSCELSIKLIIKTIMRLIDAKGMEIISSGIPWNHSISPCSKQAIHLLERNTKVVTWLMQPGGNVKDQIPCILYKGKFYSLSLRMQKAIYRHIRLKKGFKMKKPLTECQNFEFQTCYSKKKCALSPDSMWVFYLSMLKI